MAAVVAIGAGAWLGGSTVPSLRGVAGDLADSAPCLGQEILSGLGRSKISVRAVTDPQAISRQDALDALSGGAPVPPRIRVCAALVSFTDLVRKGSPRSATPGLQYVDREAWAVVAYGIQEPILGGNGGSVRADSVTFIDSRTADYLEGIEWGAQ